MNKRNGSQYQKYKHYQFRNKYSFRKGYNRKGSVNESQTGFYSTLFLVTRNNGEMRPVINLKPLNQYLWKLHFKMDTITKVLNLVKQGDWAISLDLKDAYFHVHIFKKHRKFLRFCVNNQVYQFKTLCFGPTSAPRVFTKVVSVVASHLRKQHIRMAIYLDDWLGVNQVKQKLIRHREIMLNSLVRLGFLINVDNSNVTPNQSITYIGALFKLDQGIVLSTPERVQGIISAVHSIMNGKITARHYLHLLVKIASCLELIPNARLFMRPIQLHLLENWSPSKISLDFQIPCTQKLNAHLKWWLSLGNITQGRSLILSQQMLHSRDGEVI